MRRKILFLSFLILIFFLVSGVSNAKVIIKFSHNQQAITPPHKAAEMFKQMV